MSTWEHHIELINKKIQGQLTQAEEQDFARRLHSEPDFAILNEEMELICKTLRIEEAKRNFKQITKT